jgi:prolyl-tRNA editing enzyme YbaK/EbsC (Cys-tRNA(Pro) deacylase)
MINNNKMEGLILDYKAKIREYIEQNNLQAEHFEFATSCHTVEEAAKAVNASIGELVKNVCLISEDGRLIVAIVKGEDRVSTSRVGKILQIERPRLATADEILRYTGYPAGGVPSFGYPAVFLIDTKVTESAYVYTGGGTTNSLVKISTTELLRANQGQVVRVRK